MGDFERQIVFRPAWDKGKQYGVHGVELVFYLKKGNRAIQFVVYTKWHLPHVMKRTLEPGLWDRTKLKALLTPLPADLGYHSPEPMYEGHDSISDACEVTGGKCYYDGSGLQAQEVFDLLVREGDGAVWSRLEDEYRYCFEQAAKDPTA